MNWRARGDRGAEEATRAGPLLAPIVLTLSPPAREDVGGNRHFRPSKSDRTV